MPVSNINSHCWLMITRPVSVILPGLLLLLANTSIYGAPVGKTVKPERADTVATRKHPELEPLGLSLGSFLIYTKLGYKRVYDDNIFANDDFLRADAISVTTPEMTIASDWTRHAVNLSASTNLGRYRDFDAEDYNDWRVSGNVQLDASRTTNIVIGAVYASLHEPRDSIDSAGGSNPGIFSSTLGTLSVTYRPGVFSITPIFSYNRFKYEDIDALILGILPVVIQQDDRNRTETILGVRGSYDIGPNHNVFVRINNFETDYDKLQRFTGIDRTSDGYEISTGMALDFGGITRGEFFIGYRKQEYIRPLPDTSSSIFGIDLIWKPTELTSVEFDVNRNFAETTLLAYSGYMSTLASINVDHELRRNIVLNASLAETISDFDGIGGAVREDDTHSAAVSVKWRQSRRLTISLRHEYTKRDTTDSTITAAFSEGDFQRNVSWINIEFQH